MTTAPPVALKFGSKRRAGNPALSLFLAGITDHGQLRNVEQNMLHSIVALLLAVGVHISAVRRWLAFRDCSRDRDGVPDMVRELHGAAPQTISIAVIGSDSEMTGFCALAQTTRDSLRIARLWSLS
jgi:hypothetical protein